MLIIKEIESDQELKNVLELCYRILGQQDSELYCSDAWHKRFAQSSSPMVFAEKDGKIVSAVLGRAESTESLVIGFVACDEAYRRQGITKRLMAQFEKSAKNMGYKYITLGSRADTFYEKCGYRAIFQLHGQNIYQKIL